MSNPKRFKRFFIANVKGDGLHYIRGALFWSSCNKLENVENFTKFETEDEATEFARIRNIPGILQIRKITIEVN